MKNVSVWFTCDACGIEINKPHKVKMKEFDYRRIHESGVSYWANVFDTRRVHLCDACFHGLHLIAQKVVK